MSYLDQSLYGLWGRVIANILIMLVFVLSIFKPKTKKEWRSLGAFTAFLVALFSEMYGFPLTIYFLTSVLGNKYPVLDPFTHLNGHLWVAFSGGSKLVFSILHPISNLVILSGLFIITIGWKAIHSGNGELVDYGIYKYIRHPQYSGFTLIIIGFLIQWPTIITILMAPVLFIIYKKLAMQEEGVMIESFGEKYLEYKRKVPAFIPNKMIKVKDLFEVNKDYRETNN